MITAVHDAVKEDDEMPIPSILICTVGTSLFKPNLEKLKQELERGSIAEEHRLLATSYAERHDEELVKELIKLEASERICGAEINSVASMIEREYVPENCGLFFMHSDTVDGLRIASILKAYYSNRGHSPVKTERVSDLQDQDHRHRDDSDNRNHTETHHCILPWLPYEGFGQATALI